MLKRLFLSENIEYFAPLSIEGLTGVNDRLISRLNFVPRSVIVYLVPYYAGETVNISRYAASLDYHIVIKDINDRLIAGLREIYPKASFSGFGDHSPIRECYAALSAGLGILGENGLLINEKYGSYVFIADIISDVAPMDIGAIDKKEIKRCEGCGHCRTACPTGILRGDGEGCLSEITQRKGELNAEEEQLIRKYNTVWGCDMCQSVCPYNQNPKTTLVPAFLKDRITELTEKKLLSLEDESFSKRAY